MGDKQRGLGGGGRLDDSSAPVTILLTSYTQTATHMLSNCQA
jgi:hypothetical protein